MPPREIPVLTRPLPEGCNSLFWELIDLPATAVLEKNYGEPHPNTADYPDYLLCWIETIDNTKARAWYAAEQIVQDPWNAVIEYEQDSVAHPIYTRRYILRRDNAPALAKQSALSGVWFLEVTNPGSGYDPDAAPPTVTITGNGSGATATALVSPSGTISWLVITAEGSGYTSATATVSAPSSGTTATATAHVQTATAKLVREERNELPQDDPRSSLFVVVTRRYQTLPGPDVATYQRGPSGTLLKTIRRTVATGTLPESETILHELTQVRGETTTLSELTTRLWVNEDGTTLTVPPYKLRHFTDPEHEIEIKEWELTVKRTQSQPPIGAASITITLEDGQTVTTVFTNGGRRRIPTFPTSINGVSVLNPGTWETANAEVIASRVEDIEGSDNRKLTFRTAPVPNARYEFAPITYPFPAELVITLPGPGGYIDIGTSGRIALGTSGISYTSRQTRRVKACRVKRYSSGIYDTSAVNTFFIDAPGSASLFLRGVIDDNTIYRTSGPSGSPATDIQLYQDGSLVEQFPWSTPSMMPTYFLIQNGGSRPVQGLGEIHEREYLVVMRPTQANGAVITGSIEAVAKLGKFEPNSSGSSGGYGSFPLP